MKQTINFSQFCDGFPDTYKNNFSYEGKRALFDYLEQLEEDSDGLIEYDPIALCCEYTEYKDLAELQQNYTEIGSMDDLQDKTQVIMIENSDGFIIANY